METSLPIWQIHSEVIGALRTGNRLVLVAPTGSGKTTQIPQMLLDAGLAGEKRIVVLQPRRVAARTVAARVAWERQCPLGGEVGYQIRFEDRTSVGTRISFVTEGVLLRWLQDDRTLEDIGVLLFDEFHERNLLSDAALALTKQLQRSQRPDLKIVVMSATLEAKPVAEYLGNSADFRGASDRPACPVLISEGQSFAVEVRYLDQRDERPVTEQAADAVERIVNSDESGDILVFMPGMGEINATINALRAARTKERLALVPLHGELPPEEQDRAFASNPLRKVVVATNVAETSVTIPGIRHVVDSGLARIARYDAERGLGTLFVEEISRASAEQRKGRAGRTAPGTCHRLWTESGQLNRPERNTPEIQRADLAEVVLLLHSLGINRAAEFDWLDQPDRQAVERAERLLRTLGALRAANGSTRPAERDAPDRLDSNRRDAGVESDLTPVGRQMLRLPMHPRYSRMLVEAATRQCVPSAALCAALVSGRDLLVRLRREEKHIAEARELFEASQESDFYTLMRAFRFAQRCRFSVEQCRRYGIHAQTARQIEQTCEQILEIAKRQRLWRRQPSTASSTGGQDASGETQLPPNRTESELAESESENGAAALRDSSEESRTAEQSVGAAPTTDLERDTGGDGVPADDALLRCLMAGFIDQLAVRRDRGTLECDLTEGRHGTLMRESVVQNSPLFVSATIREVEGRGSGNLTLLGLATAVKTEWIEEMFPENISIRIEHLFDRTHKRVAAVKLVRFQDLVIRYEHQPDLDPAASGRCLAEAFRKGYFELPLFNHEVKQFIARVNLVATVMPELEFPPFDEESITRCLARAFAGLSLAKEAQGTHVRESFLQHLAPEQIGWLDELAPPGLIWTDGRKLKLLYGNSDGDDEGAGVPPELQIKLHECFPLKEHPRICEGRLPVKLWLCAPDGRRLESTSDWPGFKTGTYPKLKPALQKKHPGIVWH